MWKLYKQSETSEGLADLALIETGNGIDQLKAEARRLAILDGCPPNEQYWVGSDDLKNYELSINGKYKFIIRNW
jgi:hypothetical protein